MFKIPTLSFRHMSLWILLLALLLAACSQPQEVGNATSSPTAETDVAALPDQPGPLESAMTPITLAGPVAKKKAEISGLAWYQDHLILLPQHPSFNEDGSFLYTLSRSDIEAYLEGESPEPVSPAPIPFITPDYERMIDGFEGYEAITFDGENVYLTIEADTKEGMRGYLVQGEITPDLSEIVVDTRQPAELTPQSDLKNQAYEALLLDADRLYAIYEANGLTINESPHAFLFDKELAPAGKLPFPHTEYRITDATAVDDDGRFWVINYYSGSEKYYAENDPIADQHGTGATHATFEHLERLLEFQLAETGITFSGAAPIQFELLNEEPRKWEGLARLGERGFLVATDKSPDTIFGFIARNPP
jgi:hypothetical protein